tara:strand:+ start:270 stop:518 length:249 start_codon:yes stop_codon:yes gene_type:complete
MFKLFGFTTQSSSFIDRIFVDVIEGDCRVWYKNGTVYSYSNVSRRALFKVLNDTNVSLGFFVNQHLLYCYSKHALHGSVVAA